VFAYEGPDGAGKTSLVRNVAEELRRHGLQVETFRAPGTTIFGEKIREILCYTDVNIDVVSMLLMFLADRRQSLVDCIRPALARGSVVLLDRWTLSSLAYQVYGTGRLDLREWFLKLSDAVLEGFAPTVTIVVDVDVQTGRSRLTESGVPESRFERQPHEFVERVRDGFLQELRRPLGLMHKIDGNQDQATMLAEAMRVIEPYVLSDHSTPPTLR